MSAEPFDLRDYRELPLSVVARHEAGHAVAVHCCGGWAKRILCGKTADGTNYGRTSYAVPNLEKSLLVMSAGVIALYLEDHPSDLAFDSFCAWAFTPEGRLLAGSGVGDWSDILSLTDQHDGLGMADFLERGARPYFDQTIGMLAGAQGLLDGLTELLLARFPGVGRFALKRFFAGHERSRFAEWVDRPRIAWSVFSEERALASD